MSQETKAGLQLPSEEEIHVWVARPTLITDQSLLAEYDRIHAPSEAEQRRAFLFDKHRHEYRITRALSRVVLAAYLNVAPEGVKFQRTTYGRPFLVEPTALPGLTFNLTNSVEFVAMAVSTRGEVGIDVEALARGKEIVEIADTCFFGEEYRVLSALPPEPKARRAAELWTLKESYIKARGKGLSMPLENFRFRFNEAIDASEAKRGPNREHAISIEIDPNLEDTPERWSFHLMVHHGHSVAVAGERRGETKSTRPKIVTREVVPLVTDLASAIML